MAKYYYQSVPFDKNAVTLALESGIDGLVVEREYVESVARLSRACVLAYEDLNLLELTNKEDENHALELLRQNQLVVLKPGYEVIKLQRKTHMLACGI